MHSVNLKGTIKKKKKASQNQGYKHAETPAEILQ